MKLLQSLELPKPLPYQYEIPLSQVPTKTLYYQLTVTDKEGRRDRTAAAALILEAR